MTIKKTILLTFLWYIQPILAQKDSIVISPYWHTLQIEKLSQNEEWVCISKVYENNNDTLYVLNTKNGAKKEIIGLGLPEFIDDFILGIDNKDFTNLRIVPLKKGKERVLKNIQKHITLDKPNVLLTLSTDSILRLEKLGAIRNKLLLEKAGIIGFDTNKNQTYGLLNSQKGEDLSVYSIDFTTMRVKELIKLKGSLSFDKIWNDSNNKVVLQTIDKRLLYLDLETETSKIVPIENANKIIELKADFSVDDKLFIRLTVNTDQPNDFLEDLEIWNGNDRQLERKMHLTKGNIYSIHNKIYCPSTDLWNEINIEDNQELVFIKNADYVVILDRWKYKDYLHYYPFTDIYIKDVKTGEQCLVAKKVENSFSNFTYAPDGKYIAYKQEGNWTWIELNSQKRNSFSDSSIAKFVSKFTMQEWIWSGDGKFAFIVGSQLWKIDLETGREIALTNFTDKNLELKLLNTNSSNKVFFDFGIASPTSFSKRTLVLLSRNLKNFEYNLHTFTHKEKLQLKHKTFNKISNLHIIKDGNGFVFKEENFDLPTRVVATIEGKKKILLENDLPKRLYDWRKRKMIHYQDKYGVDLTGILWYPKDFNPTTKYPMVTWIYERQGNLQSEFEIPSLYNPQGFNRSLLNEQGYFVFQPDTYVSQEGSGFSALECVTKGVEEIITQEPAIDKTKLGLIGHSFGGYETSFILGNSNLFATGVSGAGIHDLIGFTYEFNYSLQKPNFSRVEGPQQSLNDSFATNPTKYYNNSPIHFAQNYEAPILLWTGLDDYNVHWEQTRHMYIALKRYKKPVVALFYKEEGHSLSKRKQQMDLTKRVINWFDYFLKNKKDIKWISNGIDYNL